MSETTAIDLGARTVLSLSGPDRQRYLNGQVSNDVRKLGAENSIAACVTTIKGKLDALVRIIEADDTYLIESDPELREPLHARLDKYIIADDCELEDVSDGYRLVHVLAENYQAGASLARSSDRFGQPGTDLWLPPGAPLPGDLEFLTPDESESLRIRRGIPKWGAELRPDTLPAEAGLDASAVDFHKGCYIGQEVISRIKSVGRVNRKLVRLRVDGDPPDAGQTLWVGDQEAGLLTSVAGADALGFVKRAHLDPETRLALRNPADQGEKFLSTTLEIVDSQQV